MRRFIQWCAASHGHRMMEDPAGPWALFSEMQDAADIHESDSALREQALTERIAALEAFIGLWSYVGRLQSFPDRERFRKEAAILIGSHTSETYRYDESGVFPVNDIVTQDDFKAPYTSETEPK